MNALLSVKAFGLKEKLISIAVYLVLYMHCICDFSVMGVEVAFREFALAVIVSCNSTDQVA